MAIRRKSIHMERVSGETESGGDISVAEPDGSREVCLLGFAHWPDAHGVCLHLSIQHPLLSLEGTQKKVKIRQINNSNRQLRSTLCQVLSRAVGKRMVSAELPEFHGCVYSFPAL